MPNLADVVNDPAALEASVDRMMAHRGKRGEVSFNHGIRDARELEELVLQAPAASDEPIKTYQALLGMEPDSNG